MYQNIKVEWVENKTTSTGKPMKALSVTDEKGEKFNINIFSDFPDYANIIPGAVIRGELKKNDKGYLNIYSETQNKTRGGAPGAFKQAQIEKTMEKKEASIEKFQTSKEEAIKLMAAQRDAVLIVNTLLQNHSSWDNDDIKNQIVVWRNWFLLDKDFNNPPPF